MVPAGQAILASRADQRQLGRLMGTVGFAVALGPALGPAIGGYLTDVKSWRWIFWINIPIGILAILSSKYFLQYDKPTPDKKLDWKGFGLIIIGLSALLYGANDLGAEGFTKKAIAYLMIGITLTSAFVWHSRRQRSPLVDMRLFQRPGFTNACTIAVLTGAAMYGGLLLLPLYLLRNIGMTTTDTGLSFVILGLGSAIALPVAGTLCDRYGPARVCFGGGVLLFLGTAPFISTQTIPIEIIAGLFFVRGAGLALTQMPAITAAYGAVETTKKGDAAVLINVAQRIGGVLGTVSVVIAAEADSSSDEEIYTKSAFVMLTLFAVGTLALSRGLSLNTNRS